MISKILKLGIFLQSVAQGRIKEIFDRHQDEFNGNVLLEVFKEENGKEEFLLTEANALMDELAIEFSDLLQVETIGYSYEERPIRVISYKNLSEDTPAILFDGLHHAREIVTAKMPFAILLKQLYGIHQGDEAAIE